LFVQPRFEAVSQCIYPLETVLDDSIGCALWFGARGRGTLHGSMKHVTYQSRAKVCTSMWWGVAMIGSIKNDMHEQGYKGAHVNCCLIAFLWSNRNASHKARVTYGFVHGHFWVCGQCSIWRCPDMYEEFE